MSTLRKFLIVIFSLLLIFDMLFRFAIVGAPHNNAEDFNISLVIGFVLLFAIILTWAFAKTKETE